MILGEVLEQDIQYRPLNILMNWIVEKRSIVFSNRDHTKGQSKGLLNVALELGIKVSTNCKLEELKFMLSGHKAFQNVSSKRYISFNDCTTYFSFYRFLN